MDTAARNKFPSHSKKRRLNRQAHFSRLDEALKQECKKRKAAEKASMSWKKEALLLKRKCVDTDKSRSRSCNTARTAIFPSSTTFCTGSVPKLCTPSTSLLFRMPSADHVPKQDVSLVESSLLTPSSEGVVGQGRFGSCEKMEYAGKFNVCVKKYSANFSTKLMLVECKILLAVGGHRCIPFCFGMCVELHAVVMSYHCIGGKPTTFHAAIYRRPVHLNVGKDDWFRLLLEVLDAVRYIHGKGYIHNDIKLDNLLIGDSLSGRIQAYLIDFNKACHISAAKTYTLSNTEKEQYKTNHPQIAPDLRDGLVRQSRGSDVYSVGRVLRTVFKHKLKSFYMYVDVKKSIMLCLDYNSDSRPDVDTLLKLLSQYSVSK